MECPLTSLSDPVLVVILGPTASGKTALSLVLAGKFHGEIVNCDSVAMYREFEIGTAKPTASERLRAPHHLLDFVEPTGYITAGEYAHKARFVLQDIRSRGHVPIIVGGTGLYLRALLQGLFPGPPRSEEMRSRLRTLAEQKDAGYLHRILKRLDPGAAVRIHANDTPKLIRAIEVCLGAQTPITKMWKGGSEPLTGFRIIKIGLNPERSLLYQRINERAQAMFDSGLLNEARALFNKYGETAGPLKSLGYRQAVQCIRREIDLPHAIEFAQQAHRNYAKRQMTWFRREADVEWFTGFGHEAGCQRQALEIVSQRYPTASFNPH